MNQTNVARAPVTVQLTQLPSVDRLLCTAGARALHDQYGRQELLKAVRFILDSTRQAILKGVVQTIQSEEVLLPQIEQYLAHRAKPNLLQVINLTGTVLHTNLGRAVMPAEVVQAMVAAATEPCALEYDLGQGKRGDRDEIVEDLLCELTGAQAATVVNNNAAAVFLLLQALSNRKETIVSRGELIEIGGAFRIPDIMKRAGAKLIEVGTTNRTHAKDFKEALSPKTALLMKVHTSNYVVQGFTAGVPENELADIAHAHGVALVVDLGSGTLLDLAQYGLPSEPTPSQALSLGADLVTFSGDKLLGGPQAGIIVGRKDLIQKIKRNPLKRVLRVGKITLAGLEAVLRLYRDPDALPERLTVLKQLTRSQALIQAQVDRMLACLHEIFVLTPLQLRSQVVNSQIGSGSLPIERLPSAALVVQGEGKSADKMVLRFERLLRAGDMPVIGRMQERTLLLDLRCLREDQELQFIQLMQAAINRLLQTQ
jgi:L-seryl-tRNA(Ser) seleniumtransferase